MQYCLDVINGKIWGKPSRLNHMTSQRYEGTEHFHNQIVLSHTVPCKYNEFPKNVLEMQNLCPRPAESVMGSSICLSSPAGDSDEHSSWRASVLPPPGLQSSKSSAELHMHWAAADTDACPAQCYPPPSRVDSSQGMKMELGLDEGTAMPDSSLL